VFGIDFGTPRSVWICSMAASVTKVLASGQRNLYV
jgi:hypothetical protein